MEVAVFILAVLIFFGFVAYKMGYRVTRKLKESRPSSGGSPRLPPDRTDIP